MFVDVMLLLAADAKDISVSKFDSAVAADPVRLSMSEETVENWEASDGAIGNPGCELLLLVKVPNASIPVTLPESPNPSVWGVGPRSLLADDVVLLIPVDENKVGVTLDALVVGVGKSLAPWWELTLVFELATAE